MKIRKDGQCEHSIYRRLEPGSEKKSSSSGGQMYFSDSKHTEIRVLSKRSSAKRHTNALHLLFKMWNVRRGVCWRDPQSNWSASKEHRDAVSTGDHKKSALAEPVLSFEKPHKINWRSLNVVDKATNMKERKVREAFHIQKRKPGLNRDKGVEKSTTWDVVLNTYKNKK